MQSILILAFTLPVSDSKYDRTPKRKHNSNRWASALIGRPSTSAVAASKTGLWGFIRSVASEFAQHKIRANMINPGTIDTARNNPEWSERFSQGTWNTDESVQKIPFRRLGRVEDIANACVFLASDESSYITGDQLNVVGGKYTVATEG
ncbi:MAG: hypothetical protein Ct9H300mP27_02690 [Chloroflexota bacterium]|nr:MAG: hypothetical protein Ct9H300mP27_02690 [Chloroflexota bacterium]